MIRGRYVPWSSAAFAPVAATRAAAATVGRVERRVLEQAVLEVRAREELGARAALARARGRRVAQRELARGARPARERHGLDAELSHRITVGVRVEHVPERAEAAAMREPRRPRDDPPAFAFVHRSVFTRERCDECAEDC